VRWEDDAAASRLELGDGSVLTKCDQCRALYAKRDPPTPTPCVTCRIPLRPENEEAGAVFMLTRGQIITADLLENRRSMTLSIPAIKIAMDLLGVKDQKTCLSKVLRLFHQRLAEEAG